MIDNKEDIYPAFSVKTGSNRMRLPTIPLTNPKTASTGVMISYDSISIN
jgi:hypothetical protein